MYFVTFLYTIFLTFTVNAVETALLVGVYLYSFSPISFTVWMFVVQYLPLKCSFIWGNQKVSGLTYFSFPKTSTSGINLKINFVNYNQLILGKHCNEQRVKLFSCWYAVRFYWNVEVRKESGDNYFTYESHVSQEKSSTHKKYSLRWLSFIFNC